MNNNKLCLGTAQFGLNYGINNQKGKPTKREVFSILDKAVDLGIKYIDTAAAYGDAEQLLGEYGVGKKNLKIISKSEFNIIGEDDFDLDEAVEFQIKKSLKRLKTDVLDGYLIHNPENYYNNKIIKALKKCKEKDLVQNLGVSIYETKHALDAVASGHVDYVQIPYNVFDQRLDTSDFFGIANKNNIKVFGRSAFLQGLILMDEDKIPANLAIAKKYLVSFDKIIKKHRLNRFQAAFLFSYTNPGIDYVVFGVDDIDQLTDYSIILQSATGFQACREEIANTFVDIDKKIICPNLWDV